MENTTIHFNVNGKYIKTENVDPETTLAHYLRSELGLNGTKLGCEEGACGACTVTIGKWNRKLGKASYSAVNACLFPLYMAHQRLVLTVEGIGNTKKLHPVQERIARGHGTQCGFCSPGFVMSAYSLLRNNPNPTVREINQAIKGNLCRCTGYRPIVEALQSFSNEGCCNGTADKCPCKEKENGVTREKLITFEDFPKFDETQEIVFPSLFIMESQNAVVLNGARVELCAPSDFQSFENHLESNHDARIISSGLITRYITSQSTDCSRRKWMSTHRLSALDYVLSFDKELSIGANLTISEFVNAVDEHCDPIISKPIRKFFDKYSSQQVMNVASWVGGFFSGSTDITSLFLALNPCLTIRDTRGVHEVRHVSELVDENGRANLGNAQYVVGLTFPRSEDGLRLFASKRGARPGPDSTMVNCVAALHVHENVDFARVAFSFGSRAILSEKLSKRLCNKPYHDLSSYTNELEEALGEDIARFSEMSDFSYRKSLAHACLLELIEEATGTMKNVDEHEDKPIETLQLFTEWSDGESDACGRPLSTQSSDRCTTGEAVFIADMKVKDLAHGAFVLSTEPHANIAEIDTKQALEQDGVLGFISKKDIPEGGTNNPGLLPFNTLGEDDTRVFSDEEVESVGQIIGMIVAKDVNTARRAAKMVKVKYHLELPAILTMEDAIHHKSYLVDPQHFGAEKSNVEEALAKSGIVLEGTTKIGGQEHAYMETQGSVAIPGENDEWIVHSSSQYPAMVQLHTSAVLGIPAHKVIVRIKRVGGAFGGKCTQSLPIACSAVIAANVLRMPVSVVLSRHEDMLITGKRHPVMVKYRVGIDPNGLLQSAYLKVYVDGGCSRDCSGLVTFLSASSADTCLHIPVLRAEGYTLKTNKTSHTAFRGFGVPQAYFAMDCILEHIAHTVGKPVEQIREMNFNLSGGKALLGYEILNDNLKDCWSECLKLSGFHGQRNEVDEFNKNSKFVKRGIALGTTRMGMTHAGPCEQASALVQIYMDGTVAVSIGGVELGQGLNTKCLQVASRALGLPLNLITIIESGTDKTCNAPETGGSQNADIHGKAIQACCEKLLQGLRLVLDEEPDWKKAIMKAFQMRIPLQASEHIRINREKYGIREDAPTYHTTGAACVLSEIDCRTGEYKLLSVDLVLDVGHSLNPAIDIGQIEGAFMQGYGLMTCEELIYDDGGKLVQDSLYKYKLPTAAMSPRRFRVKLLKESDTFAEQVYSSKGIGEPPLMLGVATLASLRYAVMARRRDLGRTEFMEISAPLTAAKIVSFCNP